ncbi:MAG: thioredoxin-dependent thiol peroxidase [Anaerolineales bacterium]
MMSLPQVGEPAPPFELPNEQGEMVSLNDFKGKAFILYFYPKDDTPGCTKEACAFRDDYSAYERAAVEIVGVSADSPESHQKFKEKYDLPFTLLADEGKEICKRYGVLGKKKMFGKEFMGINRTTFVIDEEGKISHVFENVKPASHSQELLGALGIDS